MSAPLSYSQALAFAVQSLQHNSPSAQIDAQTLLCHVLECNTAHLAAWPEKALTAEQAQRFNDLVVQRADGVPVAYLTGQREFWSLQLEVSRATLIPRPETETLVEFVLENFWPDRPMHVADLGTGSGAIAIAVASERPRWSIVATDNSEAALVVARRNARRHRCDNIEFIHGHWFDRLNDQGFDLIVSNPPYIADNDPHLNDGDVAHEPATALVAGQRGMDDIEQIVSMAPRYLKAGGWLVLEHGYDQQAAVRDCFRRAGFGSVTQRKDLSGQPRLTAGCTPSD